MKQGTRANFTGNQLEKVIDGNLQSKGYQFVGIKDFDKARYLEQPFYTRQYPLCKSIYSTQIKCDFLLYHPEKYPECLVIESKWQQSGGSVDEKYPFLVLNIKEQYPHGFASSTWTPSGVGVGKADKFGSAVVSDEETGPASSTWTPSGVAVGIADRFGSASA